VSSSSGSPGGCLSNLDCAGLANTCCCHPAGTCNPGPPPSGMCIKGCSGCCL
jgi:hypothetical protein